MIKTLDEITEHHKKYNFRVQIPPKQRCATCRHAVQKRGTMIPGLVFVCGHGNIEVSANGICDGWEACE